MQIVGRLEELRSRSGVQVVHSMLSIDKNLIGALVPSSFCCSLFLYGSMCIMERLAF